jgi:hypothetical protein
MSFDSTLLHDYDLKSILIPSSVEVLSSECFVRCWRLTSVSFDANSKLRVIGDRAFYGCLSL